ncbi:MAG TPA: hypothetical protein VL356_13505 [Acidocella sp.]|jgi:hypothetical protein|nr:hypothetical protein [Acidocella sp.]
MKGASLGWQVPNRPMSDVLDKESGRFLKKSGAKTFIDLGLRR